MYREDRRSILLTLFGSNPQTRMLDLFMDNPLFEFTRSEVMESLGMAKITLSKTLPCLEASGVIVETRKIGKASLFRLNGDSEVVKDLERLIRSCAATLADVIKAKGGDVWLNCPTTRIIVEQGKAKGVVVTKNGKDMTIATQAVISNAGPRATVELAGEKNFPEEYLGEVRVKVKAHPVTICYVASDRPIWPENGSPAYQMIVGARRITSVVPLSTISPFYAPKGQYLTFCFAGPLTNDVHMDTKVEKQQIMLDLREQFPLFEKHGKVLKFIFKDIDDDLPEMRSRVGEGVSTETPIKNLYGVGDANGPYGLSGSNLATSSARIVAETVKKSYQPGTT